MKIVEELSGAFADSNIVDDDYLFTYRNMRGGIISLYKDRIGVDDEDNSFLAYYSEITRVRLPENSKALGMQRIELTIGHSQREILIDGSKGQFLDVFPFYRFLSRRVFTAKP